MERDNRGGLHAEERREPKIISKGYIGLDNLSKRLKELIEKHSGQRRNMTILDLGCGDKPYQPFFAGKYSLYIGADLNSNSLADVVACCEHLPFRDSSFDMCVCTQTYEHVIDPWEVTHEVNRILKKEGILLLSTHGSWPVHDYPCDYWRWTDQGLKVLLGKHFLHINVYEVTTPLETIFQFALMYLPSTGFSSLCFAFVNKLAEFFGKSSLNARLPKLVGIYLVMAKKE